ncbi:MAG: phosphoheptose isomerase [Omnitrophica bacterium GWA2_52_8]|nr:MAG: phosphoheptose isomerase [Omnitrophica bacterium GWA2_52_8]
MSQIIERHTGAFEKTFSQNGNALLEAMARELLRALKAGKKILLCGNGGSAADAQHIAAEFVGRYKKERRSLPAIALTTDTSVLTSVANDYDYVDVFSRQIEGLGAEGDVLIAISTSGNSKNVLKAVQCAKDKGMTVLGFTGLSGGLLKDQVDLCFQSMTAETSHVQEMHITALHAVSEVIENTLFG